MNKAYMCFIRLIFVKRKGESENAPVRLLIFDDRIEIISPGWLKHFRVFVLLIIKSELP